jgi:hypothetical protein
MELHKQPLTDVKFINEKRYSENQLEGARSFIKRLFENDNALYKKGISEGTIVLKGGREGTLITNTEEGVTYKIIGQCIGTTVYVDGIN